MAGKTYMPRRDVDLLGWARHASTVISADPSAFGLSPTIAASFAADVAAYAEAMAGVEPGVRSQVAVIRKNQVREAMKSAIRAWAAQVEATPGVSDAQRAELGLTVKSAASPVPSPGTAPNVSVLSIDGRRVRVRLSDGVRRGKARNTAGAMVFSYAGDRPPESLDGWKVETTTGRAEVDVAFSQSLPPGATVWVAACWVGTRLQRGPVGRPVSVTFGAAHVAV